MSAEGIDNRHLRSALEFAVIMAQEGAKHRPPLPAPKELRRFYGSRRLTNAALGRVRRIVEGDDEFRRALAAGALPELVDEVGRLWLVRPEGWQAQATELIAEAEDVEHKAGLQAALRREEKRRAAAEQAAARVAVEVEAARREAETARAEAVQMRARVEELEERLGAADRELRQARTEARHERDRLLARIDRLEQRDHDAPSSAECGGEQVAADDGAEIEALRVEAAELRRRLDTARAALGAVLDELVVPTDDAGASAASGRTPLTLPGGVLASSVEAARFLVRSGALVMIDGYNVTKSGWGDRPLLEQRRSLISRVDDLAARHGTEAVVVFDGAAVEGAHRLNRQHVTVLYSAPGESADDLIRAQVARLPVERNVVVVTSDGEIVRDVRAQGANVVPSIAFFALL